MSHNMLDRGSIQRMVGNDTSITPRLQVLDVKKIVTGTSGERFRLVLSDGQNYIQGMLATQCTDLVNSGQLKKYTIIHLKEFVVNNISGKRICVVIQCEVIQQLNQGIGKPQNALNVVNANNNNSMSPNRSNQNQNQNQNQMQRQRPPQQQQNNRPAPPQNQQPYQQRNYQRNYGGNQGMDNIQPVSSLNPYQNSWKIKVRCTMKDNMRHYSNQKGDGKFFGVDLLDRHGTEIRAVAFNEAADKFFTVFEKNGVYLISKGQVRLARKGYSHIKNDYSITLNQDAEVIPVNDNNNDIEQQKYRFTPIEQIQQVEPKSFVDVIGVVIDVSDITNIMSSRSQTQMKKRNLKIADQTAKIDVTLWNKDAEEYSEEQLKDTVIALKGCKVSGFGGRSLSAAGCIEIHPERKETNDLIAWLRNAGGDTSNLNITELTTGGGNVNLNAPRRTFAEIKQMNLGNKIGSKENRKDADYFTVVATITTIAQSADRKPWYEANPDQNSGDAKNCKVIPMGDGKWRCEKNGKLYNGYTPRYILRFCATDFTGNIWLTAYDEAATKILKKKATEAEQLFNNDRAKYEEVFKKAQFKKYVFKCRAWSEIYEDQQRTRYDVLGVQLADPQQESEKLIDKIKFLQGLKNNSN